MTDRRKFLKTGSCVAAGSMLVFPFACTSKKDKKEASAETTANGVKIKEIGIQVHSVRPQLEEDFEGTLKKLADIGFKLIEAYGLGTDGLWLEKITPEDYKKVVDDLGMKFVSTHTRYFTEKLAQNIVDASLRAGLKYAIIPSVPEEFRVSIATYKQFAENLNRIGEVYKGSGIKFGFHNHEYEFEEKDGQIPYEILLNETQSDLVTFQADLYWVTVGGMDPMYLINKYPGRFSSYHVKDADENLGREVVGSGIIDFETILNARDVAGLEYYFVEDFRPEENPFEKLKESYDYLMASDFG